MTRYTKRPVTIDAAQWDGTEAGFHAVGSALGLTVAACNAYMAADERRLYLDAEGSLHVQTLECLMTANPNDWIIKGMRGEIYPRKPDVFAVTYSPSVNDAPLPSSAPESKPECFGHFGRYEHVQGDCDTCFWGYGCLHTTPGGSVGDDTQKRSEAARAKLREWDYQTINHFLEMVAESCTPYEGGAAFLQKTLPELIVNRHWESHRLPGWALAGICAPQRTGGA